MSDLMAGKLVIRRLARLDPSLLVALVDYGRSALGEAALDEWMLPVIAGCGLLYVGEVNGEIAGAAEIIRCIEDEDLYLEGFYIRPAYQRQGYGTGLLNGVKELLARERFKRLLVTLAPENEGGFRLYQKTGFKEIDYLPDRYGTARHRLLLAAELRRQA